MPRLIPTRFQVLNYRNFRDSGWIPLERITAFIGRNESGKSALLRALHKFNPSSGEAYDVQREFPRDLDPGNESIPVCRVEFELSQEFQGEIPQEHISGPAKVPEKVVVTHYYGGGALYEYIPEVDYEPLASENLWKEVAQWKNEIKEIATVDSTAFVSWLDELERTKRELRDLRDVRARAMLEEIRERFSDEHDKHITDPVFEVLCVNAVQFLDRLCGEAKKVSFRAALNKVIEDHLPVFVYLEDYEILKGTVDLDSFLVARADNPKPSAARTLNALFQHGGLDPQEIHDLGQGTEVDKDKRSNMLNKASLKLSERFSQWYGQRKYKIVLKADGQNFRIWVADDHLADVEIELEGRSKGFQWAFSVYVAFAAEAGSGDRDAVMLLDEPGLHLYPVAQQELVQFLSELSEATPVVYTTHSPFMVDGENVHRVRAITEGEDGYSRIEKDNWPEDITAIFPLWSAGGHAMILSFLQHKKNLLVEGITDSLYLNRLNAYCRNQEKPHLPSDTLITWCDGAPNVSLFVSLCLQQKVRPVVLLDGDQRGQGKAKSLLNKYYKAHREAVLTLNDYDPSVKNMAIEDLIGEKQILWALGEVLESTVKVTGGKKTDLVTRIKNAVGEKLPEDWKHQVATKLLSKWDSEQPPEDLLDRASTLFDLLKKGLDVVYPWRDA